MVRGSLIISFSPLWCPTCVSTSLLAVSRMGNALDCFRPTKDEPEKQPPSLDALVSVSVTLRLPPIVSPESDDEIESEEDTMDDIDENEITPSLFNLGDALVDPSDVEMDSPTLSSYVVVDDPSSSSQASSSSVGSQRKFMDVAINTVRFSVPEGYSKKVEYLGGGSYGSVLRTKAECSDGLTREVAIKKLKEPFNDPFQARRIYREIKLLQLMNHDNIIHALDLYTPDVHEHQFKDVYIVTEFAGDSLFRILRTQQQTGNLLITPDHVRFIVYQLLRALKYIHSANIMHRDLKPGNLALTKDCDLTVLDFGLARSLERKETSLTTYVMTRWYRSPEVIYWNIDSYNKQADIWSVGCIAAELMLGKPLFAGEDVDESFEWISPHAQYDMITRVVGSPDEELMIKIEANNYPEMRMVIDSFEKHSRVDFGALFLNCDPQFIDFMDRVLVLDPERRLTVQEALSHPYMGMYSEPNDEPTADWTLDDDVERSLAQWKSIIWQEIQNFERGENSPKVVRTTD